MPLLPTVTYGPLTLGAIDTKMSTNRPRMPQYPAVKYIGLGGGHVHDRYGLHINQLFYPMMLRGIGVDLCLIQDISGPSS